MELLDEYLEQIQQEVAPIMIALSATGMLLSAYNIYKQYLTKAARACKDLPPREKGVCALNYKLQGKQKQLAAIRASFNKCTKTKDETTCKQKLVSKAKKVAGELKYITGRAKELRKQRYD